VCLSAANTVVFVACAYYCEVMSDHIKQNRIVSLDKLTPHPRNYRSHPDAQISKLVSSLARFGQGRSIVVQDGPQGYLIVAGHGIVEAAKKLDLTELRADILPADWTSEQVDGYLIADNLHSQDATDDETMLAELLQEQQDAGFDLSALGSSDESLRQMLEALGDEYIGGSERDEEEDELPEEVETRARMGDMWQLGRHRLGVFDCTDVEKVSRLLEGNRATAIITDPPYGEINAQWDRVNLSFVSLLSRFIEGNATIALFCSLPFGFDMHRLFLESNYQWRWDTLWTKRSGGFRVSDFTPRFAHEHIFAYALKEAKISDLIFNGWEAGEDGEPWERTALSKIGETRDVYSKRSLTYSEGQEDGKRWIRSVLEGREKPVMKVSERTAHPTQKPLEIITRLVTLLSHTDNLVYDPFLGSGTTLIACEDLGRRCVGCELEPKHADIVLSRYEQHTGQTATLLSRTEEAEHV
jgi:DNA modification methylase